MLYVSIDIETTGVNREVCQILQIGAVIEDTQNVLPIEQLPKFQCIVEQEHIVGQPMGLFMNSHLLSIISQLEVLQKEARMEHRKKYNIMNENMVAVAFAMWLQTNGFKEGTPITITAAGKNFASFDKVFLERLPKWNQHVRIKQRIIDPAVLCVDWKNDTDLPNLNLCMNRLKVYGEVTHDALADSIDVVRVLRAATQNYTKGF
jgi:DNA polymerase III alpha subunit (gram-positive type)